MDGNTNERLVRLAAAARRAATVSADAREARDRAISEAEGEGYTIPAIAALIGMSVSHVHRIVVAETERAQQRAPTG